ncbi:MAG: hypothetical protein WC302_00820 [Candidatus Paceibacterota bacterium]|jgi:hypothetical protein
MKLKYVMIDNCIPIIFPDLIVHKHFDFLCHLYSQITSAGFFHVDKDSSGNLKAVVYGFSQSLNLKPATADSDILTKVLNSGE